MQTTLKEKERSEFIITTNKLECNDVTSSHKSTYYSVQVFFMFTLTFQLNIKRHYNQLNFAIIARISSLCNLLAESQGNLELPHIVIKFVICLIYIHKVKNSERPKTLVTLISLQVRWISSRNHLVIWD